ncbi:MAG: metallophosphoesterase, partial [Sulfolobales archaeon]
KLILADLHLGYEEAMAEEGIYLPKAQLTSIINDLRTVLEFLDVKNILIVGDLKHRFDRLSKQEREEVSHFIKTLREYGVDMIDLVKGNHDNFISIVLKKLDVRISDHIIIGDILFIHGHQDPFENKADTETDLSRVRVVVYGHEHPSIVLRDRLGKVAKLPVFLEIPLNLREDSKVRGIVLPASGYYQLGSPATLDPDKYLSPITRRYAQTQHVKPYALIKGDTVLEMPTLATLMEFIEI